MKNKKQNSHGNILVLAIIFGVLAGGITAYFVTYTAGNLKTNEDLIKEFYDVETAVHVSPHGLRKHMGEDPNVIIVDLRSQEEYEEEHIVTAVNVPAYKDRDHSDYGAVERIVGEFKRLKAENPDAEFIVYCYSIPCMTGRKVGKILVDHGIYVKHLGIGWNEWRYHWTLWNHPHEWAQTNVMDYIATGSEPGEVKGDLTGSGCPIEGGLGC
jgi:rhodanese-related sulfurtransferase